MSRSLPAKYGIGTSCANPLSAFAPGNDIGTAVRAPCTSMTTRSGCDQRTRAATSVLNKSRSRPMAFTFSPADIRCFTVAS